MIDLKEIDETITKIKREGTSVKDAERLAVLYGLRAHMASESVQDVKEAPVSAYSMAAEPESEFPRCVCRLVVCRACRCAGRHDSGLADRRAEGIRGGDPKAESISKLAVFGAISHEISHEEQKS